MNNFGILKKFKINIHPTKVKKTISIHWSPPHRGWIKCNIDGLARGILSLCSFGGAFRNESHDFLGRFANFLGDGNALYADYATMTTVEQDRDKRWNSLWIESDSTIVVRAFTNVKLVHWSIRDMWLNCVAITYYMTFLVSHIYREGNGCVDSLAITRFISRSHN